MSFGQNLATIKKRNYMSRSNMKKSQSLPRNWPKSSPADIEEKPQRIVLLGEEQQYTFNSNIVKTSKYEWWNFLPKFLLEQFDPKNKLANCYFLLIAGLQVIPSISNTNGYPTVLIPLSGVLIIAAVLMYIEDSERHKADKLANSSIAEVFDPISESFTQKLWSDINVGDYVRVRSRRMIPADLLIVSVWEPNVKAPRGACFVETKSLDGETNLKHRNVLQALIGKVLNESDILNLKARVVMEHPNSLIDSFTGVFESKDYGRSPIEPTNIALRGCVLRSTEYMIGLVLNTGHDVKIMQSKSRARVKTSCLEISATRQILRVIMMLLFICFCGSLGQILFMLLSGNTNIWYLGSPVNLGKLFVIQFFYLLLLHASFVPVALYVSMALVRFLQAKFVQFDENMYYEATDSPSIVRTMSLNEELGQISHIFSDKTGTLTCNVLNFRKMSINGISYGRGITEIGRASWRLQGKDVPPEVLEDERIATESAIPHVAFYSPEFEEVMSGGKEANKDEYKINQREKIKDFCRYLAVCHEVISEPCDDGRTKISAPNPDDEALVMAATYFGYAFKDRRDKFIIVYSKEENILLEIELLFIIPFTSSRKRMSVIIRDIDGKVKIVTKGADSMMLSRVDETDDLINENTSKHVDQFSNEGLRCLIIAVAEIDDEKFSVWKRHYEQAKTDLVEIEKKNKGELNDIETLEDFIEKGLHIVGATGIEDRLQDGVSDTIEKLSKAGIKVWVLTGDKEETAINIAVACNIVLPKEFMDHVIINQANAPTLEKARAVMDQELQKRRLDVDFDKSTLPNPSILYMMFKCLLGKHSSARLHEYKVINSPCKSCALIIDGPSLLLIMNDPETSKLLLSLSQVCQAVVCCRVSPDQKRQVLQLVKTNVKGVRTLAVGDGANDVAMITAADVGVGIKGEEGVQAVNSSDFAIAQFQYLAPLLLKHGRYNYIRMSNLICFMFYKNILMSLGIFWFNFFNGFSGLKYYSEVGIQFFNLLYTSAPILAYACYDQDLLPRTVAMFPEVYRACKDNLYFTDAIFWGWIANATVESVFCSILTQYLLRTFDFQTGVCTTFIQPGLTIFTVVVVISNLKLFVFQNRWYWSSFAINLLSIAIWFFFVFAANLFPLVDFNLFAVWGLLLESGTFWMCILFLLVTLVLKDICLAIIRRQWMFSAVEILQEMEN